MHSQKTRLLILVSLFVVFPRLMPVPMHALAPFVLINTKYLIGMIFASVDAKANALNSPLLTLQVRASLPVSSMMNLGVFPEKMKMEVSQLWACGSFRTLELL